MAIKIATGRGSNPGKGSNIHFIKCVSFGIGNMIVKIVVNLAICGSCLAVKLRAKH